MANKQPKHTYDMKVPEQKQGESDLSYLKRLAKQADQRLVRLEKLSEQQGYTHVLEWAYAEAQKNLKDRGLEGERLRFNRAIPKTKSGEPNKQILQGRISAVKQFLESPTSTKGGINKVYNQRAKTINERYGTNFNWSQLAAFYESGISDKLDSQYGSKTEMRAIGYIQKNNWKTKQEALDAINAASEKNKKVPPAAVQQTIYDMLEQNGEDLAKFFFS